MHHHEHQSTLDSDIIADVDDLRRLCRRVTDDIATLILDGTLPGRHPAALSPRPKQLAKSLVRNRRGARVRSTVRWW